jgi:hypothetical protein
MDRPGLRRLLANIDAGKTDVIVVYKVDRLSRLLLDLMKMIDLFNTLQGPFPGPTSSSPARSSPSASMLVPSTSFGSYVARILKLMTLAPDIEDVLINGEEPNGLTLAKPTQTFPEDWAEQRGQFGFATD